MDRDLTAALQRRGFLNWGASGVAGLAALELLRRDGALQAAEALPKTHHPPKAKRVVQICVVGGLSHLDSFDWKPELAKRHGTKLTTDQPPDLFFGQQGLLKRPDWEFRQRGRSGLWVSELFPHLAKVADELTVLRSMATESANHTPATFLENTGFAANGFPALGSWLSHGLGSVADGLPAFVALLDGRGPMAGGPANWSSGFLPAQHQAAVFGAGANPVPDLFPARPVPPAAEAAARAFLDGLNRDHLERSGGEAALAARLRSYGLAARMQAAAPEAADLSREPEEVRRLYGLERPECVEAGRRCLLARRLLERGVRFVQVFSGGPIAGNPRSSWDAHENVKTNHAAEALRIDQPVAALVADLKRRGMLADTLVLFTTEFGRTPFSQSAATAVGPGRDHNKYGFSVWLAGAGLKPGFAYGATDELGWKAVERPLTWHDFHATVLHLLGLDHQRLTYYHNGIQRRLTNVHGHVVKELLA